jgi:hypothetical protein
MKALFVILLFISMNVWACGGMSIRPSDIGEGVVEARLSAILPPLFSGKTETKKETAVVKAVVELSSDGAIVRVTKIDVEPNNLPKEPIIDSIMKARFYPRTKDKRPVSVEEFKFVWEFKIQSLPKQTINTDL